MLAHTEKKKLKVSYEYFMSLKKNVATKLFILFQFFNFENIVFEWPSKTVFIYLCIQREGGVYYAHAPCSMVN